MAVALDGSFLHHLRKEILETALNAKVDKICQVLLPRKREKTAGITDNQTYICRTAGSKCIESLIIHFIKRG